MKRNASVGCILLVLGVLLGSCEKSNENVDSTIEPLSLAETIDVGAYEIDEAVKAIESSKAYGLFVREATNKSAVEDDAPGINIYLDDIKGVYEYAPEVEEAPAQNNVACQSFFQRIDDSDWFIIHLPFEKVKEPSQLFKHSSEEAFVNNLMISTSEFVYEIDKRLLWHNYHLATRFDVDEEYAGELWVDEESNGLFDAKTSSKFGFTDDHFIVVDTQFGDTIKVGYRLENAEADTLFSEMVAFSLNLLGGNPNLQFEYEIQVGDVRIVKTLDEENQLVYVVYKNDELREDAVVQVIISEGETPTSVNCLFMNKNRDLQIMLSDEPPILLSDLIGDSQEVLSSLFDSMKELYLSKKVINRLAWQIYIENNYNGDEEGEGSD
ncbi:hypothetical protein J1N10_14665 [Carboxylicivirga sp. A043]|uniref:hypothetical protein n=1 Tax=Carboxylicivirga litoralis TaxID=2816963 RepID=UPI0021CB81EC|nr:hypothetical protein [Carboxylicivirga sp. A043]MCU4157217.1 hypothetical protein [Carboxylicivirga sp. A043]